MWWQCSPARRQLRVDVLEVAMPPSIDRYRLVDRPSPVRGGHRRYRSPSRLPARARRRRRRHPEIRARRSRSAAAAVAAARSAASALPVAPRSSCVPGATQAVRRVGSNSIADCPGAARSGGQCVVRLGHRREVAVVSQRRDGRADRRVNQAPSGRCCVQRRGQRSRQQRADRHRMTGSVAQPHQLRVVAKAAVRAVDRRQFGGDHSGRCRQPVGTCDRHDRGRPERRELRPVRARCVAHHDPPETTTGGAGVAVTAGGSWPGRFVGRGAGVVCWGAVLLPPASERTRRR